MQVHEVYSTGKEHSAKAEGRGDGDKEGKKQARHEKEEGNQQHVSRLHSLPLHLLAPA